MIDYAATERRILYHALDRADPYEEMARYIMECNPDGGGRVRLTAAPVALGAIYGTGRNPQMETYAYGASLAYGKGWEEAAELGASAHEAIEKLRHEEIERRWIPFAGARTLHLDFETEAADVLIRGGDKVWAVDFDTPAYKWWSAWHYPREIQIAAELTTLNLAIKSALTAMFGRDREDGFNDVRAKWRSSSATLSATTAKVSLSVPAATSKPVSTPWYSASSPWERRTGHSSSRTAKT